MRGTPGIIATTRRAVLPSRSLWCHRSALVTIRSPWHRTRTIAAEFLPGDRVATTINYCRNFLLISRRVIARCGVADCAVFKNGGESTGNAVCIEKMCLRKISSGWRI